jgi:hypothetical protein
VNEKTLLDILTGGRYSTSQDLPTAREVGSSAIDKIIESDRKRRSQVIVEPGKSIFGKPTEAFTRGDLDNLVEGLIGGGLAGTTKSVLSFFPENRVHGYTPKITTIVDAIKKNRGSVGIDPRQLSQAERAELYGRSIGMAQREAPEEAMLKVQGASGGGVLDFAIEAMGDISNRMYTWASGFPGSYGVSGEKIDRVLKTLKHNYGFEKEMKENMASNVKFYNVPEKEYMDNLNKALKEYGKAHSELPAFNEVQELIREANVEFANKNWKKVISNLETVKKYMDKGSDSFIKRALE